MGTASPQKAYVKANNTAVIRCPSCNSTKVVPVGNYRYKHHTIKVRCTCSDCFLVSLDFRRSYRKKTDLVGHYMIERPTGGGGTMQVINISKTGIGFKVSGLHEFVAGLRVKVDFRLDNRMQTQLNKQVIVRSVNGNTIGCEFANHQDFEKELGFYLLS